MVETLTIEKESGMRLHALSSFSLELTSGSAEILGFELVPGRCYEFMAGSRIVLFSWRGCTLSFRGHFSSDVFTSTDSTAGRCLVVHNRLTLMREESKSKFTRGPRVMVIGPTDVGKSSLCKVLCNYAARCGWKPVLVDLDLGQNDISLPGTIGAALITEQINFQSGITSTLSWVSHFGYTTPDRNRDHYKFLITSMAEAVTNLQSENEECWLAFDRDKFLSEFLLHFYSMLTFPASSSGVIINTCGWTTGFGYETIRAAAAAFEVDMVIVMSDELLHLNVKKDLPPFVKVILMPKPQEVIPRSKEARFERRASVVRKYFHGSPQEVTVPFSQVRLFRIKGKYRRGPLTAVPVDIGPNLEGHIASVSRFDSRSKEFSKGAVTDFVVILSVNMRDQCYSFLMRNQIQKFSSLLFMDDVLYHN